MGETSLLLVMTVTHIAINDKKLFALLRNKNPFLKPAEHNGHRGSV